MIVMASKTFTCGHTLATAGRPGFTATCWPPSNIFTALGMWAINPPGFQCDPINRIPPVVFTSVVLPDIFNFPPWILDNTGFPGKKLSFWELNTPTPFFICGTKSPRNWGLQIAERSRFFPKGSNGRRKQKTPPPL